MLQTIDDKTAQLVDRDRRVYGAAFMRVDRDGRIEHVPVLAMIVERQSARERHGDGL